MEAGAAPHKPRGTSGLRLHVQDSTLLVRLEQPGHCRPRPGPPGQAQLISIKSHCLPAAVRGSGPAPGWRVVGMLVSQGETVEGGRSRASHRDPPQGPVGSELVLTRG